MTLLLSYPAYANIDWDGVEQEINKTGWSHKDLFSDSGDKNPFVINPGKYWIENDGKAANFQTILRDYFESNLHLKEWFSPLNQKKSYMAIDFLTRLLAADVSLY